MMGKAIVSGGAVMTAPVGGTPITDVAVGSTLKLLENGSLVDYLVVHQGKPSSLYDSSCDGVWLLRKDVYENRRWHSSSYNSYKGSDIHSYLNSTFLGLFDESIQSAIKQAKIPYVNGTGSEGSVASGSNGLSAKVFLLSGYEVGFTQSLNGSIPIDGACLSYFSGTAATDSKRIAYLDGVASDWWLRSANTGGTSNIFSVKAGGFYGTGNCYGSSGIRPCIILPSDAILAKDGTIKI